MNEPNHESPKTLTHSELLNYYYDSNFPELLGAPANTIALGIIAKWNKLIRPKSFRMANKELSRLSGISSNIGRHRQRVIEECVIDELPLFSYKSRGQKLAGIYQINTTIIPNKYQNNITKVSEEYPIDFYKQRITEKDRGEIEKETTTTESATSQVTGSSSEDASLETEAPEGMSNDITILKGVILAKKWPSVTVVPSYTACRRMIEEAGGDVNSVIEAIGRMSITLKYEQNGDDVAGAIMAYVKNKHYGRSKEESITKAPPTLQQQLDAEIARLDNFQKQLDAKPQFVDELAIEMLATIQENVDYFKKEIQDADTATAS